MLDRRAVPILLALAFVVTGCTAKWVTPGPATSPTRGYSADLCMTGPAQKVVRYWFNGTGELWFAGGVDVTTGRISWEGRLDPTQGAAIAKAIREGGWFGSSPRGTGDESGTWEITAWNAAGERVDFTVYGSNESIEAVYDILSRASAERFNDFMRKMPRPSLDRQLDRDQATEDLPK